MIDYVKKDLNLPCKHLTKKIVKMNNCMKEEDTK